MKKRKLGKTGREVSEISFGGACLSGDGGGYGFGPMGDKKAFDLLERAWEFGINHYDTAPIYGFGESERRLGRVFKKLGLLDKVLISSKSGITWHENKRVNLDNSPKTTRRMLENSLRDLDRDYIDFYFIHWPDERVDIRKPLEVLLKAKEEGKIHHIGLSNTNEKDLKKGLEVAPIEIVQGQYNYLYPELSELKELIKGYDLGAMGWGTYHKGVLTGTVTKTREYHESDGRKKAPWWKRSMVNQDIEKFSSRKKELENQGVDLRYFALSEALKNPWLSTALVGMRTLDYLDETVGLWNGC